MKLSERLERARADTLCLFADYQLSQEEVFTLCYKLNQECEQQPQKLYREILQKA